MMLFFAVAVFISSSLFDSLERVRLQPLFDQITLRWDNTGFALDLTAVQDTLDATLASDLASGMSDLLSFDKILQENQLLQDTDWASRRNSLFETHLNNINLTPTLQQVFVDFGFANVYSRCARVRGINPVVGANLFARFWFASNGVRINSHLRAGVVARGNIRPFPNKQAHEMRLAA